MTVIMLEMISELATAASIICAGLSLLGCLYALLATLLVRRFMQRPSPPDANYENVTILKPLHGSEVDLEENLASFCSQRYPAPVQIIFGVQTETDPAIAIVERLVAKYPKSDLKLVVDGTLHGSNSKVSNLINMTPFLKHDIVVLADSDMYVEQDYLLRLSNALAEPDTGIVTCLYRGKSAVGLWSQLAAMAIEFHFLPSVIMGLATGLANPCFGSTIALRRETLVRIGGFEAFADALADDHAIGKAVTELGLKTAIPSLLVAHTCPERSFSDLFRHELRWAQTVKTVDSAGFIGSGVTHALPFAVIAALLRGLDPIAFGLIAIAVACRLYLQLETTRAFKLPRSSLWLAPCRDLISFMVYLACFVTGRIDWRGQSFTVGPDGTLVPQASGRREK